MGWKLKPGRMVFLLILMVVVLLPLRGSTTEIAARKEQIRSHTRSMEFDYLSWTASALGAKFKASLLGAERYLEVEAGKRLVIEYLDLHNEIVRLEGELTEIISKPSFQGSSAKADEVRGELADKKGKRNQLSPIVESVIQGQIETALNDLGLTVGGQPFPPVLYHAEPDAYALIVSPRDEIRQEANLMLQPDLSLDERIDLEERIERELDYSALVVGVGGVGLYPAMIIETGSLEWLYQVIGHEWTHNYLTLRPLGIHYFSSPELQTINETVADLSGQEIQQAVFRRFYPERLPDEKKVEQQQLAPGQEDSEKSIRDLQQEVMGDGQFDFRYEMHLTRVVVDRLLAEGNVSAAEEYLEGRREFFWENGYPIRKLNQAYFAFYGSYAAQPGGAAGEEGVDLGAQLRKLKSEMPSYSDFMHTVAWRWRIDQFQRLFAGSFSR